MIRCLTPIFCMLLWFGIQPVRGQVADWHCGVPAAPSVSLQDWARRRAQPAAVPASGTPRLLLLRVDFSDLAGSPLDELAATGLVVGADQMFADMSAGRLHLAPLQAGGSAITPVLRLPLAAAVYGIAGVGRLRDDALAAAAVAGFEAAAFDLDVVCFGPVAGPAFNFSGFANVGARGAWLRDSFLEPGNLVHELGHNFGLNHANGWDTAGGPPTGAGQELEYADVSDSMGRSTGSNRHFNAQEKSQLGWLDPDQVRRVDVSGVYRVYAHDDSHAVAGARALVVARNSVTNYWLELRQRFVNVPGWTNSLAVRWAEENTRSTLLLDATPGSLGEFRDAPLRPGWTFSDRAAGRHFRNRGFIPATGDVPPALDVEIQFGQFPDNHSPAATLSAPITVAAPDVPLAFTVNATDADGDVVSYAWDFGDGNYGANAASVVLSYATAGEYLVRCTVTDGKGGMTVVQTAVTIGAVTPGRIEGFIRRSDGSGVGGVWVLLGGARSTLTDAQGRYLFTGMTAGNYRVQPVFESGLFAPVEHVVNFAGTGTAVVPDTTYFELSALRSVTVVPAGAAWRWLADGSNAGTSWTGVEYIDAGWNEGPAPLGYGYADLGTTVGFGPNPFGRWITTYFRRQVVVTHPEEFLGARLSLQVDDGAVVYLNGNEVWRRNLPEGPINFLSLPRTESTAEAATHFVTTILGSPGWRVGTNVVAVEVHQWRPTDTDLRLDLHLQGLSRDDVVEPARLLRQPVAMALTTGQSGSFRVEAVGTEPLSFQWFRNGVAVSGATQAQLAFTAVQAADGGVYTCQIGNVGGSVLSDGAALTVESVPGFVLQPLNQTVVEGATATFAVEAVGSAPLNFQWTKNGVPIAGATNASLILNNVPVAAVGTYQVIVSNGLGAATSDPSSLSVLELPRITKLSSNRTVLAGTPFSLAVTATGAAPLRYDWRSAGAPIPGGTNAVLAVPGLPNSPAVVEFVVVVSNPAGSVTSAPVAVAVSFGPVISEPLADLAVALGQPATFTVVAAGSTSLTYRWWHAGVLLPNATGPKLAIAATKLGDAGVYQVVVNGVAGAVTNVASLTIWVPPSIVAQPVGFSGKVGDSGQLSVTASGDPIPTWQWYKEDQPIPGATEGTLHFGALQLTDAARYRVRAMNSAGVVDSATVTVSVVDPGGDGGPKIVVQPVAMVLSPDGSGTLRVEASGTPPLTYQWVKDGIEIGGAQNAEWVVGPANATTAGFYWVQVANAFGTTESIPVQITVGVRPQFVIQPASADVLAGADRLLIALVTSDTPLSLQWIRNGTPLSGETSPELQLRAVGETNAGEYRLIAQNLYGAVTSAPAIIRVLIKPVIKQQPTSVVVSAGAAVELAVDVSGTPPLSFTWRRNGFTVAIRTNQSTLLLPAVTSAQAGSYVVTIANSAGSVVSSPATVSIGVPVAIQTPPVGTNAPAGSSFSLHVLATGDGPLQYQWRHDGQEVAAGTNAILSFAALQPTDAGAYSVVVRNSVSSVESSPVQVVVFAVGIRGDFESIQKESAGLRVRLKGTPGLDYTLESSTDLRSWRFEERVNIGTEGYGEKLLLLPDDASDRGARFFRVITP